MSKETEVIKIMASRQKIIQLNVIGSAILCIILGIFTNPIISIILFIISLWVIGFIIGKLGVKKNE